MSEDRFKEVISELEGKDRLTEEVYELENIKHVYSPKTYNKVMSAIYDEEYDQAVSILEDKDSKGDEDRA